MAPQARHSTVCYNPLNFYTWLSTKTIMPIMKCYITGIEYLVYPAVAQGLSDGRRTAHPRADHRAPTCFDTQHVHTGRKPG